MNITNLISHLQFSKIFDLNKDPKTGKYSWVKIAKSKDLPTDFIDKYFFQIYNYKIEKYQTLSPFIIEKYGNYLNWNILLYTHDIPENLLEKFIEKINWHTLAKTQKLSFNFLKKYKEKIDLKDLELNTNISEETLNLFKRLF